MRWASSTTTALKRFTRLAHVRSFRTPSPPSQTLSCLISSTSTCLKSLLLQPGAKRSACPFPSGGYLCNAHTFDCYLAEVQESCCDEGGLNCPEGECAQQRSKIRLRWIQFHNLKRADPSSGATTQVKTSPRRVR